MEANFNPQQFQENQESQSVTSLPDYNVPQSTTEPYTLYEDPAILNPAELATFPPKTVKADSFHHDHHSHLVSKRTPVRDGRNITITDNHPD